MQRDIVARGRTQARIAVALMLVPHFFLPLGAFLRGNLETGGIETARFAVWIGFLYLLYRGFRLIRWIVLFYATIVIVLAVATLIRHAGQLSLPIILLNLVVISSLTTGLAMVLLAPAIRAFLTYQLGGDVAEGT